MIKTIVTNTKSRRNIKYLFKNNDNKTPNAINYHGGLPSRAWTYLKSLTWFGNSFHAISPRKAKVFFWRVRLSFGQLQVELTFSEVVIVSVEKAHLSIPWYSGTAAW